MNFMESETQKLYQKLQLFYLTINNIFPDKNNDRKKMNGKVEVENNIHVSTFSAEEKKSLENNLQDNNTVKNYKKDIPKLANTHIFKHNKDNEKSLGFFFNPGNNKHDDCNPFKNLNRPERDNSILKRSCSHESILENHSTNEKKCNVQFSKPGKTRKNGTSKKERIFDTNTNQNVSAHLLHFKNTEKCFSCDLCQLTTTDSCKFINHCNSKRHVEKLKQRFTSKSVAVEKKVEDMLKDLTLNQTSEKKVQATTLKSIRRSRSEHALDRQSLENKHLDKKMAEDIAISNEKQITSSLNVSSIQILENQIKCTVCQVVIPLTYTFDNLWKNVSNHCMGKKHLKKLSQTFLENDKNEKTNSEKADNDKNPHSTNSNCRSISKRNANEKNVSNRNFIKKGSELPSMKVSKKSITSKQNQHLHQFICLSCSFFGSTLEANESHMKSASHKKIQTRASPNEYGSLQHEVCCIGCDKFLYGSLYLINEHYRKCASGKINTKIKHIISINNNQI